MTTHDPILTKDWGVAEKLQARRETIIEPYQARYGRSIPTDRQYWTLCGRCCDEIGNLVPGCELDHLTKEGFITHDQFYGVEIIDEIHQNNTKVRGANWFYNDLYQEMVNHRLKQDFRPAIVNFDTVHYPNQVSFYFGGIMAMLARLEHPIMLVGNFVLRAWTHKRREPDYIIEQLNKVPSVQFAQAEADWDYDQRCYEYSGSGPTTNSIMGTIILHKR